MCPRMRTPARLLLTALLLFVLLIIFNLDNHDDGITTAEERKSDKESERVQREERVKERVKEKVEERVREEGERRVLSFTRLNPDVLVHSPFDDRRQGNMNGRSIRFLVIARGKTPLHCRVLGREIEGSWYELAENHQMAFGSFIVSCELPSELENEDLVERVEISVEGSAVLSLDIDHILPREDQVTHFTFQYGICVPLVYGSRYSAPRIVEWAELVRRTGVESVSIYVDSASLLSETRQAIQFYERQGFFEVTEYHEPVENLWYHGQLALIHDCLLRHSINTKFLSFHDVDEVILSLEKGKTVASLLSQLPEDVASLRVSTQYMNNNNPGVPFTFHNVITDGKLDARFTKCIVRPICVFEQGIHHTSRAIQDSLKMQKADESTLRLFHYRRSFAEGTKDSIVPDSFPDLPDVINGILKKLF